ncbi:hypothetical protein IX51_05390 [uncultured archaeon]|nr:hypothetical protein IX51_05390 [uncultured archaeon]
MGITPKTKEEADSILKQYEDKCLNCGARINEAYSADLMSKVETNQSGEALISVRERRRACSSTSIF